MDERNGCERILVLGSQMRAVMNFRGRLIRDLVARGHEVVVAAPGVDRRARDEIEGLGARAVEMRLARAGMNPLADIAYCARVRALLKRERPDLLLTSTAKPNVWGAIAARSLGILSIAMVTGLGYAFTPVAGGGMRARARQKAAHTAVKWLYRASTACNDSVVFQNPDDARDFLDAGCLRDPRKMVLTDGSGVDTKAFAPVPMPERPTVLMVSRLLGNKGVREYARAVQVLKRERPDASFQIVGHVDLGPDGIGPAEIESWASDGLEYLGARADVRPALSAASLCVLPSYREGTPRALLEAMAMGRPIITCDVPGCRETVEDGENGYLVPPRDAEALADRMRMLLDDPQEGARMGDRGRAMVERRYEVANVNARLIQDLGLGEGAAA